MEVELTEDEKKFLSMLFSTVDDFMYRAEKFPDTYFDFSHNDLCDLATKLGVDVY